MESNWFLGLQLSFALSVAMFFCGVFRSLQEDASKLITAVLTGLLWGLYTVLAIVLVVVASASFKYLFM